MVRSPQSRRAFTLAELLIAVAITSFIVVMLGTVFGSLANTSGRANQRIDAFRDARAAMQMIQRDLANLVHASPTAYLAIDDRYADPNTATTKNRQIYGLIATKNKSLGDLCAVGYYCRWEGNRYTLRRYFRNSDELSADAAYFASSGRSVPPWNLIANGAGTYMRSDKLYQPSDTDALTANPPTFKDETLASNVWDLQITAYKSDGTVDTTSPLIMDPASPTTVLPAAIDISFRTMSPQASKTVMTVSSNPNDWMDDTASNYIRLIKPHAYEFHTRINF
jgi:type II secretory pathway pseudopilin PulG